ncbi:MAG: hypothetical protein QM817_31950 [Archangium sp.]
MTGPRRLIIVVGLVLAATAMCLFWPRNQPVRVEVEGRVVEHWWERRVDIERFDDWWGDGKCSTVPRGARVISRANLKTGTQRQGNRYVDVYEEMCTWKLLSWRSAREVTTQEKSAAPSWPQPTLASCDGGEETGCEREGRRDETLSLVVQTEDGGVTRCSIDAVRWNSTREGARVSIPVIIYASGSQSHDCSQLVVLDAGR